MAIIRSAGCRANVPLAAPRCKRIPPLAKDNPMNIPIKVLRIIEVFRVATIIAVVPLCLACLPGVPSRAADRPLAYGFDAMGHPELLPFFLPNGTQTRQFITYDPAGKNQSGFFNPYEENGEYVFFDEIGPGCLVRQQMNVFSKLTQFPNEVRIRYYFDDEPKPRIDMTFAEFFGKGGKFPPFTPPLTYFDRADRNKAQAGGVCRALLPARVPETAEGHRVRSAGHEMVQRHLVPIYLSEVSAGHERGKMERPGSRFAAGPPSMGPLWRGSKRILPGKTQKTTLDFGRR